METRPVKSTALSSAPVTSRLYRDHLKRLLDIGLSATGLILLGPLIALIALWVWLDSGRPVFYRGVRTGLGGRRFRIFKFRTMVPDAENLGGGTTADEDPRITRPGRLLRRFKLDELPQLFNVLLGDMSLVGPRPELTEYTDRYGPEESVILTVRPGITDYASLEFIQLGKICGSEDADRVYESEVLPRKNQLRIRYAESLCFREDVKIIARTVLHVFRQ